MNAEAPRFRPAQIAILFAGAVALVCVAGCASPVSNVEIKQAPTASLSQYKTIQLEATTKDLDFEPPQLALLTERIADGLQKCGRFDTVSTNSAALTAGASLKLSVEVQFVVGPNMGHIQSIETAVALADARSGKIVASANISSHTAWSLLGGNMAKTIDNVSDQIVDFATKP